MQTIFVGKSSDFEKADRKMVAYRDTEICVFKLKHAYVAYLNNCLHQGGPVCEGEIIGKVEAVFGEHQTVIGETFSEEVFHVVCPWHGFEFNMETGASAADHRKCLKKFEVEEKGEDIYVIVG